MVKTFAFLQDNDTYYFDGAAVQRVIDFVERFCRLSDECYGEPFKLLPWQKQIVTDVFGWKRRDNDERRFVHVYVEVPRKNGKTYFVAALLLYLLMADGVSGAQVYATACSREQSGILYKAVLRMRSQSKFFAERLDAVEYRSEVKYPRRDGLLKALSGESKGSHGKYPSAVVCDELHEWTDPKAEALYEALTSGFGARKSPLVVHITTAGFGSQPTLAKRLHDKARQFAENSLDDPTFYGVVYGADLDDDWTAETTWQKANPSWARTAKNLAREYLAAKSEPSKENTFKRLYLNVWTQQQTRWLDMAKYDSRCEPLNYESLKGKDVILGLDLSQIYDLTAISLMYPDENGKWTLAVRCYMPLKQVEKRSREDAIPYDQWQKGGWIRSTVGVSDGQTIDYDTIVTEIGVIASENKIVTVGYDPSNAVMVIPKLESMGIHTTPIWNRPKEMSPACKEFDRRLTSGEIVIEQNPCLRWQAGNVEVKADEAGNIRPVKPAAKGSYAGSAKYKVDGIVAAIIAAQATLLTYGRPKEVEEELTPAVYFVDRYKNQRTGPR